MFLSRQNFCRDKHTFVATKIMLVAAPASDRDVPANSIFSDPIASTVSAIHCDESPSTCQCEKENKKGLKVSNFALLLVVFK